MAAASTLIQKFTEYIINPAILVVFSFGFLVFIYGLLEFMLNLDNTGKRTEGTKHMLYGLLGILIMVSVKGIIVLLDNTFQLGALNGTIDAGRINSIDTGSGSMFK